ncbi:MAG TPA: hypothetical protein VKX46_08305, partial [Ktedonobacteraceae bacterium]|nr:hypothetical protein [Ktedonobacteraceae bacterium]
MKQMQRSIIPVQIQRDLIQGDVSHRLLGAGMLGAGVMVFLTLLEVLVLVLFNPFHVLGGAGSFAALFVLPVHAPLSLLVPLGELVVSAGIVLVSARPMAEVFYLRDVHRAQEEYYKFYTPLAALVNLRKAADEDGSSSTSLQEQQVSILDLVRQQDIHQLILGAPGAGKTTVLRVYQYLASLRPIALVLRRGRIPVYVPMKNYSLFLKKQLAGMSDEEGLSTPPSASIFEYLYVSDLPGMRHLSPCVQQLAQEGRLLLLCDGLNELDRNYLARVNEEIAHLMLTTRNRFVMTCREVDYREQEDFVQLVEQGQAARVVIYPLRHEQMFEFVERYIERQDKQWKHTAGQIMQVIDRSRLRYHCTNPMMLFALMGVIDKIGIERGKQIDTRGRLLRAYVSQLIADEQRQARWSEGAPGEQEVVRFLSELACAARWANDRDALQLRVSSVSTGTSASESDPAHSNFVERADELQLWLDEHPARGPFSSEETQSADVHDDVPLLLQFALSSALIELSPSGVLSFRHELIADYLVAEYFFAATESKQPEALPIRGELLEHVGYWSEPVAMWAGLLDNPLVLAERFGAPG